ncbi:MAG: bifunctional alpha/beta hydrolase/class I SAM-dependent methyltransferase [Psychromonas sp.]
MSMETGTFTTFDDQSLFYRSWKSDAVSNGKVLLLLHRGHEHSERLQDIAENEAFKGYTIYSFDNRGHGYSEVKATFEFMDLVRDLNAFVAFVCTKENKKEQDIFLIANSVAGVVASTWVHDYAPKISGMALVAPAFKIKLYVPFAKEFLKLALTVKPKLNITSYVKSKFLTHDKAQQLKYDSDPRITPHIPARQLTTLLDTGERIVSDAAMIVVPTLVLSAAKDYVVDSAIQGDFYANLSSPLKRFVSLDNFFHGVLYEENSPLAIDEISRFINDSFAYEGTDSTDKLVTITGQECDKIRYGSLPLVSKVDFYIQRNAMKYLGFISRGMEIGLQYGFDSGVTLDHIYKNKAQGITFIGKFIDKGYLNSIGWKGIRQRKVHSVESIKEKIKTLQLTGKEVRILDIAGGPARYLIEIAESHPDVSIQVRDYQIQNVEQGRILATEKGLTNITYTQSDAFDPQSYVHNDFQPNIVVISGVFELFPENALINNAIKGVASIIEDQGFLIYTGQPWHPQLEQIANVLGNHQDSKWIMRRRSQYELDKLFAQHGFSKDGMLVDNWGIFTVSSALFNAHKTRLKV